AARAVRDDRDRAGRRDRGDVAVAQAAHRPDARAVRRARTGLVGPPDAALPLGEYTALLRQPLGLALRLVIDEMHQAPRQLDRLVAVVRDAHTHEQVRPAHDAEPDAPDPVRQVPDLRQRVV